jgi:hypothetical protein
MVVPQMVVAAKLFRTVKEPDRSSWSVSLLPAGLFEESHSVLCAFRSDDGRAFFRMHQGGQVELAVSCEPPLQVEDLVDTSGCVDFELEHLVLC